MTATDHRRPLPHENPARPRSRPQAALRVALTLALALSMVPIGIALSAPSEDAVAFEAAPPRTRYPSLTDYLSQAQDERLVGTSAIPSSAADTRPSAAAPTRAASPASAQGHPEDDGFAANVSTSATREPASALDTPKDAPDDEAVPALPDGAGATEIPDQDANEEVDADASDAVGGNASNESRNGADATDDGASEEEAGFFENLLELFASPFAEDEEADVSTEGAYASTGHDLYLKYLLADSTLVSAGDTMDDIFTSEDKILETIIAQYSSTADLLDPGADSDYYLALMDTTRFLGNTQALDVEFARTDNLGHVVEGPLFDPETGIAYVPKRLYESDERMAIVAQVLLSYDLSSNAEVMIDVHIDNENDQVVAAPSQSVRANALDVTTTFPVASPASAKSISLRDLTVYVNGSESPYLLTDGKNAAYDRATGELTIFYSPMNLFSIEVRIAGRSIVDAAMRAGVDEAEAISDPSALATFPGVCFENLDLGRLREGDWFSYQAATNYVWPNPAPGDVSKDVRDFCVPYCYGYASDPESLYDIIHLTSSTWDDVKDVGLVAQSEYFNCVVGTPDEVISGQDWRTSSWPVTSAWSESAGGRWAHIALECGHVKNPIGTVPTTAPYMAPVGMRILRINEKAAEPYVVIGFLGSKVATQSGSGIYKFRLNPAPKLGGLKMQKRDSECMTLTPQGDATLDPTTFEITYTGEGSVTVGGTEHPSGSVVMSIETKGGVAQTAADALPEGTYSVREVSTGSGYRLTDTTPRTFTVVGDQYASFEGSDSFRNDVVRGGVMVEKRDAESRLASPQGDASLDGTTFEIVNRSAGPVRVGATTYQPGAVCTTLTIANGRAATAADALPYGTYDIRETKPGVGYLLSDARVRTFQIRSDGEVVQYAMDESFFDEVIRGGVVVEKRDRESRLLTPLGGAALDGTVFEVTNESAHAVLVESAWAEPGEVCCRLTATDGRAESARDALPYGTYSIREVLPGEGYLLSDAEARTFHIGIQGQRYSFKDDNAFFDQVKRGDITLLKVRETDMARLAGVPFKLTSQTTGESHVLVTDANGRIDTSSAWIAHSCATNANDAALDQDGTLDASALTPDAGTWFGQTTEGWAVAVDDGKCALPYDTYTLEEIRCPANEGLALVVIKDIAIRRDLTKIDLGTIDDKGDASMPDITTFASDASDLDRIVSASSASSVVDRVSYANLVPGEEYTLRAVLMDKDRAEAIEGSETALTFTAKEASGQIDVVITASLLGLDGSRVVVFEELLFGGGVIAEHKDLDDSGQTVIVATPKLKTHARDATSGGKVLAGSGTAEVVDTIRYSSLTPGMAYAIEGALMVKSHDDGNGEAQVTPLRNADGTEVTSTIELTPDEPAGEAEVRFALDSCALDEGCGLVVFERLLHEGEVIASHEDPSDADQTLVCTQPAIETNASDASDGDKTVCSWGTSSVIDNVKLTNVVPGKRYHVLGVVLDPVTGLPACPSGNAAPQGGQDGLGHTGGATGLLQPSEHPSAAADAEEAANVERFWGTLMGMLGIQHREGAGDGYATFSATPQAVDVLAVFEYVEENRGDLSGMAITTATVTPTQPEHEFSMEYELDTAALAGDYVVCDVLMADDAVAATHLDLASAFQTFSVEAPLLSTNACDKRDGDHEIAPLERAQITDNVAYSGLAAGKEYVVRGFLMDKSADDVFMVDGEMISSEVRFTPNDSMGTIDVAFEFDASAIVDDTELVVFEQIFKDGELIAEHADLDDAAQTIAVRKPPLGGMLSMAGDASAEVLVTLVGASAIVFACGSWGWRRSRLENERNQRLRR